MKKAVMVLLILAVIALVACAVASFAEALPASSQPTWFEHVDLMQVIIGGLFVIVLWFTVRTLSKIDRSQNVLFDRLDLLCKDFYELRGEHRATKDRCGKE